MALSGSIDCGTPQFFDRGRLVVGRCRILVSVLCRTLLAQGDKVRVLDALFNGDESIRGPISDWRFELRQGDSRDITALVAAMRDVQAVVHLEEIVGDPACGLDERTTREINLGGTLTAAKVAKGALPSRASRSVAWSCRRLSESP
jgi:nucleoside-diphosphate-sugar epimerase